MTREPPLTEKARNRAYHLFPKAALPDKLEQPWVVRYWKVRDGDLNRRYYIVIPRARLKDFLGSQLSLRDAARRAEGIWSWSEATRSNIGFMGMDRLLRSPAPASYDNGYDSPRRRYCEAHCSKCGLHFSSDAAFQQHVWERHRHPAGSNKLVPAKGRDTGCANMGSAYDAPICQHLPSFDYSYHYIPGVRIWEHIQAERVREYHANRKS